MTHKARISPLSTTLLIFGILLFAAAPPIAMIVLVLAWLTQRDYRKKILGHRYALDSEAYEKARHRQLEAARKF